MGEGEHKVRPYLPFLTREGGWEVRSLLLLACLIVRLVALDADPPPWLSWSTGLYTDEGFYTLDARHEALFGTWAPGDFHDRLLSPLLSLLQQVVFALGGVGLAPARLLSVGFGLLTVCVFWLGLRRAWGARAADFGALFLGLAPPFALYNRLALQETPTVFWLALAFTLWVLWRAAAGAVCPGGRLRGGRGGVQGAGAAGGPGAGGGGQNPPTPGAERRVGVCRYRGWSRPVRRPVVRAAPPPNCRAWRPTTGSLRCSRTHGILWG